VGSNRPFAGDFYLPLEDNSPEVQRGSKKKKNSTPSKKKTVQIRPKKTSMVKLNLDVVDSDEEFELPKSAPPNVREGLRLLAESRRAEKARLEMEQQKEAAKLKSRSEEKQKVEAEAKRKRKR
ncbi:hypothetical protein AALP_AAs40708U000100, partial [Arabis alpina]